MTDMKTIARHAEVKIDAPQYTKIAPFLWLIFNELSAEQPNEALVLTYLENVDEIAYDLEVSRAAIAEVCAVLLNAYLDLNPRGQSKALLHALKERAKAKDQLVLEDALVQFKAAIAGHQGQLRQELFDWARSALDTDETPEEDWLAELSTRMPDSAVEVLLLATCFRIEHEWGEASVVRLLDLLQPDVKTLLGRLLSGGDSNN